MQPAAVGHFEPSLAVQFLPRCHSCGERHPLAYRPPIESDRCLKCGAPCNPGGPVIETVAVITGQTLAARVARFCFSAGASLRRLADRLGD